MKKISATDQQKDPENVQKNGRVQVWESGRLITFTGPQMAYNMVSNGTAWVITAEAIALFNQ